MELEKLKEVLKKLEGVYKSTADTKQKERVKKEIDQIHNQIRQIEEFGEENILNENEAQEEVVVKEVSNNVENKLKEKKILSNFPIKKIHPASNDSEVNAAITYIDIFEEELWGALSDFHLKLDYYNSKERDKFYNAFENIKRLIKQYLDVLNELSGASISSYIDKLKLMKNKQSRALLIDSVKFMNNMNVFLSTVINDYNKNGNIILNPKEKIYFSNIEGKRLLNDWTIIDALVYINEFCIEFVDAINLPDEILKIND